MRLRQLTDTDWDAFSSFGRRHFGIHHPADRAFYEHWFKTPRYDGWAAMALERPDGSLAGVMLIIVVPVWFAQKQTKMHWISTIAVDADAQAIGAGAKLFLWAYRTLPLLGSMCGNELSIPISSTLGLDVPGMGMRRFLFAHRAEVLELCQREKRAQVQKVGFTLGHLSESNLAARLVDRVPADFDALWKRFSADLVCTTDRHGAYMEWRYVRAPRIKYSLVEMRAGDQLRGFAVFRVQSSPKGPANRIIDFIADPTFAREAWIRLLNLAARTGALFTDFIVVGTCQDAHLTEAGFVLATEENGLEGIPNLLSPVEYRRWSYSFHLGGRLASQDQSWRHPEAVYFTKGDGDRDWPTPQSEECAIPNGAL